MGDTWITDLTHFDGLDLHDPRVPAPARKLAAFMFAIARATARLKPGNTIPCITGVRCRRRPGRRPCGAIIASRLDVDDRIQWGCTACDDNGLISHWRELAAKTPGSAPERKEKSATAALQLEVTLLETKPKVWRRIVVPQAYSFWDLHIALQSAMGWTNTHLHMFEIDELSIGIPDPDGPDCEAGWETPIASVLAEVGDACDYEYDFGDGWRHRIRVEAVIEEERRPLPLCLDGRRTCPPEDCGGPLGYGEILLALRQGTLEPHLREWLGEWTPERFEPGEVVFMDPKKELKWVLQLGA